MNEPKQHELTQPRCDLIQRFAGFGRYFFAFLAVAFGLHSCFAEVAPSISFDARLLGLILIGLGVSLVKSRPQFRCNVSQDDAKILGDHKEPS